MPASWSRFRHQPRPISELVSAVDRRQRVQSNGRYIGRAGRPPATPYFADAVGFSSKQRKTIMRDRPVFMGTVSVLSLSAAVLLIGSPDAHARITKIQITSKESPAFGGYAFKDVGAYEKIVGKA